ncbi:MAG TPA: hypothetical protein VFK38_03050 [Candidatus Limnocylindrales bacterium]|nr:hypothetical protein [Candidatus Limnocylindrales bacterium]
MPRPKDEGLTSRPKDEGLTSRPKAAPDDDTEGHAFLLDPTTARQLARERGASLEREARERARRKEARPNRQQPG